MTISKPEKIFFFCGAVSWLPDAITYAQEQGIKCYVFAVSRHLNEIADSDGKSFKEILNENQINYFHADDINDSTELKELATPNSMGMGIGEAYTFNENTLALFNRNVFDFMTIRMPKYRGGAHFTWQILQQNRVGAWYIQMINEDMVPGVFDNTPIIKSHEYILPVGAKTPLDYFASADKEGLNIFKLFLTDISNGAQFHQTLLQENFSLYFPRLYTLKHGFINWSWTCEEIERFINAFDEPYAGASTFCNGNRIFLKSCQLEKGEGTFHPFMNGMIYRIYNQKVFVAMSDGTLIIERVTNENDEDVISTLKVGFRFYTPFKYLEEAMLFNAEFDASGLKK